MNIDIHLCHPEFWKWLYCTYPKCDHLYQKWSFVSSILLMEEILHHLGCRSPVNDGMFTISTDRRISSVNTITYIFYLQKLITPTWCPWYLQGQSWDGQQEWPWRIGIVNMKNFTEEGSVRDYSSKFQCIQKFWENFVFFVSQEEDYVNLSLLQCLVSVAGWRVVAWAALVGWCLGELHGSLKTEMGQNHEDANVWTRCTYASI